MISTGAISVVAAAIAIAIKRRPDGPSRLVADFTYLPATIVDALIEQTKVFFFFGGGGGEGKG